MTKERIPISGDLKSKVKQLMEYAGWYEGRSVDISIAELFPGTDPAKLSFAEMVDFLKLKRFGSLVDDEMNQQVFIMDLSFNPEITDELMVIYFDLNKEIFCITHES